MTETPYSRAFYDMIVAGSSQSARKIIPLLLERMEVDSVLDVGCGTGAFLKAFVERGVGDIQGVDGDYVDRAQLLIDPVRFRGHDLGEPLDLGRRFDLVLSLEVAEHLPPDRADGFVDNLCRHGSVILFSAAIPLQGGTHHVNEQWPSYWVEKFASRGYEAIDCIRPLIWQDRDIQFWYRQNCLIFANTEGLAANPGLTADRQPGRPAGALDLVHPEMFLPKALQAKKATELQGALDQMCSRGGAYSFSRNPDGSTTIRKI